MFSHRVAENAIDLRNSSFGPDSYGNGNLSLFSIEDFASYEDTTYLPASPRNAERLLQAVDKLDKGKDKVRKLIE